jgi:hypothetical protein
VAASASASTKGLPGASSTPTAAGSASPLAPASLGLAVVALAVALA